MSRKRNNDRLIAAADFDGPTRNRRCTDLLCLLLLVICWVILTAIGAYALTEGDYRLVVFPLDYDGNICGTDFQQDMTEYPYLLYVNAFSGGVCVKECPNLENQTADNVTDIRTMVTYGGIWQTDGSQLDPDFIQMADYSNSSDAIYCTDDLCFPDDDPADSWTSKGVNRGLGFAYYASTTYHALQRCYTTSTAKTAIENQVNATYDFGGVDALDEVYEFWNRLFSDLYVARQYVLGFGFGCSLIVSLAYIFMMRLPFLLTFIVWGSILVTIASFFYGGYAAWQLAQDWESEDPQTVEDSMINATNTAAVVLWVIGIILVLLGCCLRKAIQMAIVCVKEAGKAVNSMMLILLVPVLQAVGFLAFMAAFCVYAVHLASLGEISTREVPLDDLLPGGQEISYRVYEFDDFTRQCGWYMLFCLFWTANFIVAAGDMIVAVAVAKWYFTKQKWKIGSWTVFSSIWAVLRYHLGTCAFGSLLIASVQIIRSMIARAQKAAKDTNNKFAQYILCCCQCCFWCLEKCLKFINKNAYVQTAIFSTAFCHSCRESFNLIFRNMARVGAVTYISAMVLIAGKLFISTVTTVFGYIIILENIHDELFSVGGPVAAIFLISYWISDFFMGVFDMCITTVLHCFVADEEMFDGDEQYAQKSLKRYVDKCNSDEAQEQAR